MPMISITEFLKFIEFLFLGTSVGVLGTMVGAGGGFFVVPYLLLISKMNTQIVIGTSMTMVFFNAISGTLAYLRQKRIDIKTGIMFAVACLPGSIVGAYISRFFNNNVYSFLFGLLLFCIGIFILLRPKYKEDGSDKSLSLPVPVHWSIVNRTIKDSSGKTYMYSFNQRTGLILSLAIGFMSTSLGIGGGILLVPLMIYLLGFPVHVATATSFFILLISSFFGVISHFLLHHVDLLVATYLSVGAIIGAQIGAVLAKKFDASVIQKILAVCLILVAVKLILM